MGCSALVSNAPWEGPTARMTHPALSWLLRRSHWVSEHLSSLRLSVFLSFSSYSACPPRSTHCNLERPSTPKSTSEALSQHLLPLNSLKK